jgi:integrase
MERDPFWNYKVKHIDPKIPFLTTEELKVLQEKEITIKRLDTIRDIFLFACYTGFAYIDVATLMDKHLKTGVDGNKWLIKPRQKTGISERVPLLPPALKILDKYACHSGNQQQKTLLPIPSNQKVNAYLKELADICGIITKITFHIARHTFATTVTLQNGVPIDSVSKMLGHRSIKTTQIYANVNDTKISNDTKALYEKFS